MTEHDAVLSSWLCQHCYALNDKNASVCSRCKNVKEPYLVIYTPCVHCRLKNNGCDGNECRKTVE